MLPLLLTLACLVPQPAGGEEAPPLGLRIVIVDVGQGDGAVICTPDGTVHVVDAGPEGQGQASMLPAIAAAQPARYGYTFASHYHSDHIGGLDSVLSLPFSLAYDRGTVAKPSTNAYARYVAAAGSRRWSATAGQVIALGGGVTATVISENGMVSGQGSVPVGGTVQEENARSIGLLVEFGDFDIWLGGDLTGGGNGTADVETKAGLACGDVDVYHADHHGSKTSSNLNFLSRLRPEVSVFSAGSGNSFGHPTPTILNRLNQPAAATFLVSTTRGAGAVGFAVGGSITIDTDGRRYRVTAEDGAFVDFNVDENPGRTPAVGDLRVSEVQRDPSLAATTNGQYLELTNVSATPVSLRGVQVTSLTGAFTVATEQMLYPGRPILLQQDGDPARNGGLPLAAVWPYRPTPFLRTKSDVVSVMLGATVLDRVDYTGGLAGGTGVAAERTDLLAAGFAAAQLSYNGVDLGSPARRNDGDASALPAALAVTTTPGKIQFHSAALSHGGAIGVVGVALGNTGFPLLGQHIPLDADPVLQAVLTLPGFVAMLPAEGYRSHTWNLPSPNPGAGLTAFAAHIVFDVGPTIPTVSVSQMFVLP